MFRQILILFVLFLGFSISTYTIAQSQNFPLNQTGEESDRYFVLDPETLNFIELQKTPATVDSLINYGIRERNRDARIAYHVAREALALAQEIGYIDGLARAHNLAGIKYLDFGEYELAMTHYLTALEIETELENETAMAMLLSNIGLIHLEQKNYTKATEYLFESIQRRENLGQYNENYLTYNNLGVIHRHRGDYEIALEHFFKANELSLEIDPPDSVLYMISTLNIGNTYRNLGNLEQASGYLFRADEFFSGRGMRVSQSITNLVLGQLHQDIGEFEHALEYAFKSLELAQEAIQRERIKNAYELIAELYENMGDYEQAYQHYKLYHAVSDSLLNIQRAERINEMQIRFDVENKDREIMILNREAELQEAKIARQNLLKQFLIGGLVMLLVIAGLLLYFNIIRKKHNRILQIRRKQIQNQNEKLSALNKEKDDFMSMATHDLRNPLSAIRAAVELIQSEPDLSEEELGEYLKIILMSSDRMIFLISDLLKIQSIDDNDSTSTFEKLNVNAALKQSLNNFDQPAKNKQISFHLNMSPASYPIMGNSNNLIRVFDNLISNAIKYSPNNSTVYLSTKRSGESVVITVRDEGPGIKSDERKHLFNKFARISNQPTGSETSTGLGLYIVKRLAETMNGTVWCESDCGKGSSFIVEFPIAETITRELVSEYVADK